MKTSSHIKKSWEHDGHWARYDSETNQIELKVASSGDYPVNMTVSSMKSLRALLSATIKDMNRITPPKRSTDKP